MTADLHCLKFSCKSFHIRMKTSFYCTCFSEVKWSYDVSFIVISALMVHVGIPTRECDECSGHSVQE